MVVRYVTRDQIRWEKLLLHPGCSAMYYNEVHLGYGFKNLYFLSKLCP